MKRNILIFLIWLSVFIAPGVVSPPALRAETADLKPLMRQNFKALFELQSLAQDPQIFADPRNAKVLHDQIERLAGTSHILLDSSDFEPDARAEFYAATRQFDKAAEAYGELLGRGGHNIKPSDVSEVVRSALSVAVRVKRDPDLALDYLKKSEDLKAASPAYQALLESWKKDAIVWKHANDLPKAKDTSASEWLSLSKKLMSRAESLKKFPADHSGDLNLFRAIDATNEALSRGATVAQKAEGFLVLGDAYGILEDPLLWALDDYYYEACILTEPHTKTARSCYEHLSKNVTFGFTGSSGTDLPQEERVRLGRLELLSK